MFVTVNYFHSRPDPINCELSFLPSNIREKWKRQTTNTLAYYFIPCGINYVSKIFIVQDFRLLCHLCWVPCFLLLCWVSLCWMSSCWVPWHPFIIVTVSSSYKCNNLCSICSCPVACTIKIWQIVNDNFKWRYKLEHHSRVSNEALSTTWWQYQSQV